MSCVEFGKCREGKEVRESEGTVVEAAKASKSEGGGG